MFYEDKDGSRCDVGAVPAADWLLYVGSQESARGWAHLLVENDETRAMVLCAHPRPDLVVDELLMGVRPTSVFRDDTAERMAKRMKFWDPRSGS